MPANRGAYLNSEHHFTIKETDIQKPAPDEVTVQIMANGICGSDVHFYKEGRLGNFVVTRPYIPGHEASGIVTETGADVKTVKAGDRVVIEPGIPCGRCGHCRSGRYNLCPDVVFLSAPPIDGTFRDYVTIRHDSVYKIPDSLSFEHAALIEPVAVAVHAVNRSRVQNGESAVIIGAGPIGLLTLQAFKAAGGGKAVCVDKIAKRLTLAAELGADEVIDASGGIPSDMADVVFETAGSAKATEGLFAAAKPGGRVVQVGWPDENRVKMNIADFLDKELDYIGVNRYANAYPAAIAWTADRRINVEKVITHRFPFAKVAEAFRFTSENPGEVIKTIVLAD